jgi:hypothetical protein
MCQLDLMTCLRANRLQCFFVDRRSFRRLFRRHALFSSTFFVDMSFFRRLFRLQELFRRLFRRHEFFHRHALYNCNFVYYSVHTTLPNFSFL